MIQSKANYKYYLEKDLLRFDNNKPTLKDLLVQNEVWYIYRYIWLLRKVEFYKNCHKSSLLYYYYYFLYKRLGFNLRFTIYPNTVGPGLRIFHCGDFVHIKPNCVIGMNCTILPGVVIGNKNIDNDDTQVIIGDNCYLGLGVKIFGQVLIGNNVTIGANSVVLNDIPDNCVVAGIPARIIKRNGAKL